MIMVLMTRAGNPLYTNVLFLLIWCNKFGIIHCSYPGVTGYNFFKKGIFCLKICFTLTNSVDPDK